VRLVPLVDVFGFFVHWLVLLATARIAKCPPEVVALHCRMIGTWMPWAFLLQELFELLLRCCLLASRGMIHSRNEIVWLALSGRTRVVPLAFVVAVIIRDASGCYHCASGTTPASFPPARTSRASCHEALQQFSVYFA
jgi:hypothetical protein